MSLPIVFRVAAKAEFDEAFDWYEQQQPELGIDFLMCVAEVLERIESFSDVYETVFEDVRRAVVRKFPYLVLYKVESSQIVVLAWLTDKSVQVSQPAP
jgi:monomeric isocitrate dehydrogenase